MYQEMETEQTLEPGKAVNKSRRRALRPRCHRDENLIIGKQQCCLRRKV